MKKTLRILFSFFLTGCATSDSSVEKAAILLSGHTSYTFNAGTSCWPSEELVICGDSDPRSSNSQVVIEQGKKFAIKLKVKSTFTEGYYVFLPTKYFEPSQEETSGLGYTWKLRENTYKEYIKYEEENKNKISSVITENIKLPNEKGYYLLQLGTWWKKGDVFFNLYVQVL